MSLYEMVKSAEDKYSAFEFELNKITRETKKLISVLIELSPVCNFHCPFCYSRKDPSELKQEEKIVLNADFWKRILDQLSEMHVMTVGFTGGECLQYSDFREVYEYAIKKGFWVGMISNMSILKDETLELFKKYPPKNITITVYGASDETYKKICGIPAFSQVKKNMERLKEAGITFRIQTTVCKENVHDMSAIAELAKNYGIKYSYGESLISFQQCSKEAQTDSSVDEEEFLKMVKLINADTPENINRKINPAPFDDSGQYEKGTKCSAGQNSAFINFEGYMQPCVSFSEIKISTNKYSVEECWKQIVDQCQQIINIPECNGCIHWGRCRHCFAMHYYDTHDFTKPSPRLCFKLKHPEEAARIEAYYNEHGELPPYEE